MKKDVQEFVGQCLISQSIKYSTGKPFGLMQPTETPQQIWEDVATDFIVGLPISKKNTCIMVVDRLSKYAHFGPFPSSHSASQVAELFTSMMIKLHGVPRSIILDRDPIFTRKFWRKLFELMGNKLCMSSAYHPQSDGQFEVLNRCLEQYLRAFVSDKPSSLGYNTSYH